jgi:hypothetical protein
MANRISLMAQIARVRSAQPTFLLGLLALAACRPGTDTAQGTAERFVDAHYVNINIAEAKPFCVGPALAKIEDEQRLTAGQVIDDSTRKPHVGYQLLEKREEGADRASFLFEGSTRVEDGGTFTRKWMIITRREPAGWRVSNYDEFE